MRKKVIASSLFLLTTAALCFSQDKSDQQYKLLATTRTSTMQKEIDQTSAQGYRILVGAPTSGSEMVLFLSRDGTVADPYKYRLLATSRTGTMQKELADAADAGFRLIPSTMMSKKEFMGGEEIVLIMERPPKATNYYEYKLLATTRTSTLQKEVTDAKNAGFAIVGMVNRDENIVVMERSRPMTP